MAKLSVEEANAQVLVDIIVSDDTGDVQRIDAIQKIENLRKKDNFFETMVEGELSRGECPHCKLSIEWAVPEDELNKLGIVTAEQDERVKKHTTAKDCKQYQQACGKKRLVF